jgi:Fe-S cluster assembly protein SufD
VKAAHGTSTGQLDEDAILYMQQRGISRPEAEEMLVEAFMAECVTPLNNEAEQEQIMQMIRGTRQ